jgi:hypothetical protein
MHTACRCRQQRVQYKIEIATHTHIYTYSLMNKDNSTTTPYIVIFQKQVSEDNVAEYRKT